MALWHKAILGTLLHAAICTSLCAQDEKQAPTTDDAQEIKAFEVNGKPVQIRCGELHFARVPREYWQHRLRMCKAMGLNTVCAYLFWNFHERSPSEFTWSGQADAAEFCRLAQQEGLWVILRPGPYACAEWEMGGLPWWLLKYDDIQLRSRDLRFLAAARRYLNEVGRVLGPLQSSRGGPIIMVQAENEYGFYGTDAAYMGEIRQALIDAGFDVPLFACNPVYHLDKAYREDLLPVVNFGSNPEGGFAKLRELLPNGPLMCGEYYSGWFDTWGNPHHTGDTGKYLRDLEYMLKNGQSFSIYMAHGGTTFGLWAGADRPFKPDTSCYDYDAPISEAGWATDKFHATRELMAKHLMPDEKLPEIPAALPVTELPEFELAPWRSLLANLPPKIEAHQPSTFETCDLPAGCMLYRTTLRPGLAGTLQVSAVHDAAWVMIDGKLTGVLDRRKRLYQLSIPARDHPAQLDILVEAMGRVNFGKEVHDRKGLHGPVTLQVTGRKSEELTGWEMFTLPLHDAAKNLRDTPQQPGNQPGPKFYRAEISVDQPADTFLDMRSWGKGVVWVNDHCLGRFWNIGPVQTMYCPGVWLHAGPGNEVVVLDLLNPERPAIAGLKRPIMDQLRPELDFAGGVRANRPLTLEGKEPVHKGSFPAGDAEQIVHFAAPVRGRYFCLESKNAHGDLPYAATAELDLLNEAGEPLSHEGWTIAYVDSEERNREDGTAENAIDGQTSNHWHTQWGDMQPVHPHRLVIDLSQSQNLTGFRYVPRAGSGTPGGRIKDYRVYVGDGLIGE